MKKTMSILGALAIAAALTPGFTACTSDDNIISEQPSVKTYTVIIPATMPDDTTTRAVSFDGTTSTSTFASTEKVYVYNVTKNEMMGGYLQPSNITNDGKNSDLTGELTGTAIEAGNELKLMYNLNNVSTNKTDDLYKTYTYFDYKYQDGTQAGVLDGAEAMVIVSSYTSGGALTTTSNASFQPMQSMFRFLFEDENNTPINVKRLMVKSKNNAIVQYLYPLKTSGQYAYSEVFSTLATATTNYIYMTLCINESLSIGDELTFTATDDNDIEYKGTKAAPTDGFVNGKYYYNAQAIQLTKQAALVEPTITWTSVWDNTPVSPDEYNRYDVKGSNIDITISGTSRGYRFYLNSGGTVHLDNVDAIYSENAEFIYCTEALTVDVNGTNTITCKSRGQCIFADGNLKLTGNGTLTVTATGWNVCGLLTSGSYNYPSSNNSDPSVLAADGYTVTRSDRHDNGDGTRTWTYTVRPTVNGQFTINSDGDKVYFSPGNLQATTTDLGQHWTWHFAENQWSFKGDATANTAIDGNGTVSVNGTVDLFGSSTEKNYYGINNSTDYTDYNGSFVDFGNAIGNGWRTLTRDEWTYLINNHTIRKGVTVNGIKGHAIRPDGVSTSFASSYTAEAWAAEEAAGSVFLPLTGIREGTTVSYIGEYAYYQVSEYCGQYVKCAWMNANNFVTDTSVQTRSGKPVRLVHDVQ